MATKKQDKRRRKLRVHGPSASSVGAPPAARPAVSKAAAPKARGRARRTPAVPSLQRSMKRAGGMFGLMLVLLFVTAKNKTFGVIALPPLIAVAAFVPLDLFVSRWVYRRVMGADPPKA